MLMLHRYSVRSLMIRTLANGNILGQATGFVVTRGAKHYLVTNYHVLSGRHSETGKALHTSLALPDTLYIAHAGATRDLKWHAVLEPLNDEDGAPRFLTHPRNRHGAVIDVAVLPLSTTHAEAIKIHPVESEDPPADMVIHPGMPVSIVGFPAGLSAGGLLPVWKTGHIASEPAINVDGLPCFLIDATTRCGMSGSPVYLIAMGAYPMNPEGTKIGSAEVFMGIYSSRVRPAEEKLEIGRVWKPHVIDEIISGE